MSSALGALLLYVLQDSGGRSPPAHIPYSGHQRLLVAGSADHHALVVEQGRGQPVVELLAAVAAIAVASCRAGRFGHGQRLNGPCMSSPG